jgi:hypothetical protein
MMGRCLSCGTAQGPFIRDAFNPKMPMCGYPPRYKKVTQKMREERIRECLARREKMYDVGK